MSLRVVALVALSLLVSVGARAGEITRHVAAAATPDGHYVAYLQLDEHAVSGSASLVKVNDPTKVDGFPTPLATAWCGPERDYPVPFAKWKWNTRPPEVARLVAFADLLDDKSDGRRARIVADADSGRLRLELLQAEHWWPVRTLPGYLPRITGTIVLPDRLLVRIQRENDIQYSDEVYSFTQAEIPDLGGRWLKERGVAALATGALRELREKGARPFTTRPRGAGDAQNWDARRSRALDPVIERWESAAAFGPLTPQDLFDFEWLLAERAEPGYKLTALRSFSRLRERDPAGAEALLVELAQDPDAGPLVPLLRAAYDPLRHLGEPIWRPRSREELGKLSNDELLWLHRGLWAFAGFRFADAALSDYFALFGWYKPVSEKAWRGLLADPFFRRDPNRAALVPYPQLSTLKAIAELEKERGLAPPALDPQ